MPAYRPCLAFSAVKVEIAARNVMLYACCQLTLATSAIKVSIAVSSQALNAPKHSGLVPSHHDEQALLMTRSSQRRIASQYDVGILTSRKACDMLLSVTPGKGF